MPRHGSDSASALYSNKENILMSMAQYGNLLILSNDEREELVRWAQSRTLPAGDVFRARLILALADGVS